MPNIRSTTISNNLPNWISGETDNFDPQTLLYRASDFAEVIKKYNGVPSGYPVTVEKNSIKPATANPDGYVLFDQHNTSGQEFVAVVLKGIIILPRLPKLASGEALAKPADSKHFIYREGE